jgi:phosphatidylglycerol:prolipoprotein diacylglycerol transferase
MSSHYIHNIDPVILELWGNLAVRWYGLSYLAALVAAILILKHWAKQGAYEVPTAEVSNYVVMMGIFGVFIGGRLGYVLFYNLGNALAHPLDIFKVWDGGMSSHGGFLGVILFTLWYARKHGHSFWNLIDHMACMASLGIAFGRFANFINGELWGRVTQVSWGVIFPQSADPPLYYGEYTLEQIAALNLPARHPSQLYQAGCEGLLVFALMLLLRKTSGARRPGFLSACYLVLYAVARITMEFFREPDHGDFFIGWLSTGQFYSLLMLLGAAVIALRLKLFQRIPGPAD